ERRREELTRQEGELAAQERQAKADRVATEERLRALLAAGGVGEVPLEAEALAGAFPPFAEGTPADRPRLEDAHPQTQAALLAAQQERDRLARALNLGDTMLDEAACAADLADRQHERAVKVRAGEIVRQVRNRMLSRVLPNTERNMSRLLPLLTADRYRD